MLSFVNITLNNSVYNTSALSYQSPLNINFTINPSLSLSINSSDLVIDNLTPGTTADSNDITISVVTNASYGYTLSAITSNNNLVRLDNVGSVFSSISTNANLSSLDEDENNNIWGYSTSLDNGSTWSNYNGLSSSRSTTLSNTNSNNSNIEDNGIDTIDFKIAAKASSTQPSGIYTNTITFYTTTKPTPMNLAESYFANGKSRYKGYYTMQDMNSTICEETEVIGEGSQTQLIDIRDGKVYWATKLADGHCWMTQNLDLDLDSNKTYTHWDTDLGWTIMDENATWKPKRSTINFIGTRIKDWQDNDMEPYSANPGDIYYYTSDSNVNVIQYDSLQECITAGHNNCNHYHAGNYYNWSAAVASNNTDDLSNINNSTCPKGWRLPENSEFNILGTIYHAIDAISNLLNKPLYLTQSGYTSTGYLYGTSTFSDYWSSTPKDEIYAYRLRFNTSGWYNPSLAGNRYSGFSVRCLAR